MHATAALLMSALLAGQAAGQTTSDYAHISHCKVTLIDDVQVPATQAGVLTELMVEAGATVKRDDQLAQIDDRESQVKRRTAQLEYEVALTEASNDVNVRAAEAAAEVAEAEVAESAAANAISAGAIPETQVRREQLTAKRARLQIEVATMEFKIAGKTAEVRQAQLDVVDLELERRKIRSPLEGVVQQIYRHRGEWVQPGEAVMRVVRLDRLRIEGFLSAEKFAPQDVVDQPVKVKVRLSHGEEVELQSRISYVSRLVEASGEYRVWADVDNRRLSPRTDLWLLSAGLPAEMTIELASGGRRP